MKKPENPDSRFDGTIIYCIERNPESNFAKVLEKGERVSCLEECDKDCIYRMH